MAYDHTQTEVNFTTTAGGTSISATATGAVGARYYAGVIPFYIRGFSVSPLTGNPAVYTSMQIALKHQSLATGATSTVAATLKGTATDKPGHVIYKEGMNVKVSPGECVFLKVDFAATTAATSFAATMYIEPAWEQPQNNPVMRVTT